MPPLAEGVGHIGDELGRHLGGGQHVIDHAGGDGAARHAVVLAGSGFWTMAMPPSPFTALTPSVPSLPVPESTMQMARSCWSWASDLKK